MHANDDPELEAQGLSMFLNLANWLWVVREANEKSQIMAADLTCWPELAHLPLGRGFGAAKSGHRPVFATPISTVKTDSSVAQTRNLR